MTTAPTPIAPVQPAQTSAQAGKQPGDAANEVEFSQVLSGEIAQQKQRGTNAGKDDEPAADAAAAAASPADPTAAAAPASTAPDTFLIDTQQARSLLPAPDAAGEDAATAAAPLPAAVSTERAPVELTPGLPAAVAAAVPVAAGRASDTKAELPQAADGVTPGGKSRTPRTPGAQQAGEQAIAARMSDPGVQAKSATAVSASQVAERQPEGAKPEFLTELMSHPAMRATAQAAAESAVGAASNRLAPQVGTPAWGQALGEKIVWMANSAQQTASLTLNPPNLGPVQVVIEVSNDQATANFFAAQPEVRQAIEAAFPRLKDMMNDAGIQLGQATVSADTPAQHEAAERQAQRNGPAFAGDSGAAAEGQASAPVAVSRSGRGLVDTFA